MVHWLGWNLSGGPRVTLRADEFVIGTRFTIKACLKGGITGTCTELLLPQGTQRDYWDANQAPLCNNHLDLRQYGQTSRPAWMKFRRAAIVSVS